jgi:hypothetical protein
MTLVVEAEEPGTATVWLPFSHQPLTLVLAKAGITANRSRRLVLIV